jgi:predicted helicase
VGLTEEGVNILDPFTGTGTFIVRLLQSGLIKPEDLERKFKRELHANEIVLLAYYIAAINIEETYHGLQGGDYQPFDGIVLTDTFQMFENAGTLMDKMFPENNERVVNQKQQEIRVIIGNPPYSAGQTNENDGNKNLKYLQLDKRIWDTYARYSTATLKNSLYDSYVRALRWASDRIKDKGIVCFITNGSFIDNNSMDGLRKCFFNEFSRIYCFNLRGNQRTSGETSRQEGGKIFGSGSRAPIAITILVKNPEYTGDCKLFYHDIGDYLSREEKLHIITDFGGIQGIEWTEITPNKSHDWINQRDPVFSKFISLGDKNDSSTKTIFDVYSSGVKTNRDAWCYNFSCDAVTTNMGRMIDFYNQQVEQYQAIKGKKPTVEKFIDTDPKKISWSAEVKNDLTRNKKGVFNLNHVVKSTYRPFCKQFLYMDKQFNNRLYQMPKIFPKENLENFAICVTGVGVVKDFSAFISNVIPDLCIQGAATAGQCFPLYTYTQQSDFGELFASSNQSEYIRNENIPNEILSNFQTTYSDAKITKEDIFYYVYGILHSPEYKNRFGADLKKMLPRIPYAEDFWIFSKAGRELAHWHINYETIEPYPLEEVKELLYLHEQDYQVEKMTFGKRNKDKTEIVYNSKLKLRGIPLEAYNYKVCDRSALEWIIERYQVTKDKQSGITNNPNDWSDDPRYIVDLVKRVVRVSVETVKIVDKLPPLNELN